jgi:hypothetical protein
MNKRKISFIILLLFISILGIINKEVWAYRGSAASHCSHYIRENIEGRNEREINEREIKEKIEKANNEHHSFNCKYDYAIRDSNIIVYCKIHGSGSNKSILDSLSVRGYYKDRFNHTGFNCTAILVSIGIVFFIIRFLSQKFSQKRR